MIALIETTTSNTDFEHAMRAMFAARKEVFVDLLGWQVPVLDGKYEIDQFDNEHARYLIVTDEKLRHLASARLLPTIRPHILDTLFPALCTGPVPTGSDAFEITRFCLDRNLPASARRDARDRLITALALHALANNIRTYTGVAEPGWLKQISNFGWDVSQLGQLVFVEGRQLGALRIEIDSATPALLEAGGVWSITEPLPADYIPAKETAMIEAIQPIATSGAEAADQLRRHGWCILRGAADPLVVAALAADLEPIYEATPFCDGDFYGGRTKRFGSLLKRSRHAAAIVQSPEILAASDTILRPWCDTVQLNLIQAIALHPGAPAQFPHRDQDMWQGVKGEVEYLVNVMWPLTPFTPENGATLIYSDSHGSHALEGSTPGDPTAATCDPGDAILFLGSTLHGAGSNRTQAVRKAIVVSYCLGWLKPYENQWLAYPPSIARNFEPELAALVGYQQHRPNLGNYEGVCPSVLLQDEVPAHLGSIDALRPDQREAVAEHRRQQEA